MRKLSFVYPWFYYITLGGTWLIFLCGVALDFIFEYVLMGSTRLILNWLQDSKGIPASQFSKRIERLGHYALLAIRDF